MRHIGKDNDICSIVLMFGSMDAGPGEWAVADSSLAVSGLGISPTGSQASVTWSQFRVFNA